jgi:hypothetical protein
MLCSCPKCNTNMVVHFERPAPLQLTAAKHVRGQKRPDADMTTRGATTDQSFFLVGLGLRVLMYS